jgi:hypothetical protein
MEPETEHQEMCGLLKFDIDWDDDDHALGLRRRARGLAGPPVRRRRPIVRRIVL